MKHLIGNILVILAAAVPMPTALSAQAGPEAEVIRVVDSFHAALSSGDSITALSFLAEDVVILESGGVETLEQYRSGHLRGDMRYAQAVDRQRREMRVVVSGDMAWAQSANEVSGRMNDREINSQGVELVVLSREGDAWLIKAVHWSSRQR